MTQSDRLSSQTFTCRLSAPGKIWSQTVSDNRKPMHSQIETGSGKNPGTAWRSKTTPVERIVHAGTQSKTAAVKMAIYRQGASLKSAQRLRAADFCKMQIATGVPGVLLPESAPQNRNSSPGAS